MEQEPEEESEDDDEEEEEEEMRMQRNEEPFPFPVLAPPEEFQNCLSPSAMYDVSMSTYHHHQQRRTTTTTPPNGVVARHVASEPTMRTTGGGGCGNLVRSTVSSPAYSQDSGKSSCQCPVRFCWFKLLVLRKKGDKNRLSFQLLSHYLTI